MDILQLLLSSIFSALVLFIVAKLTGHKQMSQLNFFDYINGITIGSIAAELSTELEEPWKPFLAMVVYGGITLLLGFITSKYPPLRKFINGTPTILMNGGKLYRKNMKKAKVDLSEFMVMCRQEGYFDLNDIQTAVFEYNGRLTVLPKATKRPATPADINIVPPPACIHTEVIMDGKVLSENLARMGLDNRWLKQELACRGYEHVEKVFLAVCDGDHTLTVFPVE